jgi:very-short-patch-repair endonuclease
MHGQPRSAADGVDESELVDAVIARIVHRGVVAHEDLVAADVDPRSIEHRIRRKRLIPLWRGVYLVGHPDPPPLAREYAALRFAGDDACLSDRPAAANYGLLPTQVDPTIHLSLKAKRTSPKGLKYHTRDLHTSEIRTIHGDIRITTMERTILDIAPTLDDEQLENVVADAIRRRLTTPRKLERQLDLRKGARGSKRIRAVLDQGPQWTASKAEAVFLGLVRRAGLPAPEANRRHGRRMPDFVFAEQRVIVEIDGYDSHKDVIAFDSDRERDTERTVGRWRPARYSWRHLRDRPYWVVATLAVVLAQ